MKIKITYFKDNGKYYSNGKYTTDDKPFDDVCKQLREMFDKGIRPGLVDGFEFHAYCKIYTEHGPLPYLYLRKK